MESAPAIAFGDFYCYYCYYLLSRLGSATPLPEGVVVIPQRFRAPADALRHCGGGL